MDEYGWVAIIVAIVGSGGIGGLMASRSTRENTLIDQQQEELARIRKTAVEDKQEMQAQIAQVKADADQRYSRLEAQNQALRQWASELVVHINSGQPPPPPLPPSGIFE